MDRVRVHLSSFKCFEDTTFCLNNITFLTGANAAGKSTLIQALLLADSALEEPAKEGAMIPLFDSKRALDLGRVDNLINCKGQDTVCIEIDNTKLEFRGADEVSDGFLLMHITAKDKYPLGKIAYLNAERVGPRREVECDKMNKRECGCHGEHTASVILNNDFTKISTSRCNLPENGEEVNFRIALDSWVSFIFPNITVRATSTGNTKCQIVVNNENLGVSNIITNVGFGISYALPILVTCLLAERNETIIIENPEAHLHAKAQSNMGYFLGVMAAAGLRIVVETHSEHIINGIRRTIVCTDMLAPEAVTIYFLEASKDGIQKTEISMDKAGNLSDFPVDFFDQQRQDSLTIFEYLRSHK